MSNGHRTVITRARRTRGRDSAAKDWVYTFNNPTERDSWVERVNQHSNYHVCQLERGEQGTIHLQGFVQFIDKKRLSTLQTLFGRAVHWEKRKGSPFQCIEYCTKDDTRVEGPWKYGKPSYQGKRTELDDFRDLTKKGATDEELLDSFSSVFARYPGFVHTVRRITSRSRERTIRRLGRRVVVLTGPTGSGKSRFLWDNFDEYPIFSKSLGGSSGSLFFDGYEGQKVAFFDEFLCDMRINVLNQLLDRYPAYTEVKGCTTSWVPLLVVIATNLDPDEWYKKVQDAKPEVYSALMRRIDRVVEFPMDADFDQEELISWMKEHL